MSNDQLGPVDYLVAEFPAGHVTEGDFEILLDAVDRHLIRVIDIEFVHKTTTGEISRVPLADLDIPTQVDPSLWDGACSRLLDDSDVAQVGTAIAPGSAAAVVLYENLWTLAVDTALHSHGARLVADGRVSPEDLERALDLTETS